MRIDTSLDRVIDWMDGVARTAPLVEKRGRVSGVTGALIRATVPGVRIADLCRLKDADDRIAGEDMLAEVVGFDRQHVLLSPLGSTTGISNDTQVIATGRTHEVPVGPELLGKVLDGLGHPLRGDVLRCPSSYPVLSDPPDPMRRRVIDTPLALGVRVLDGLLTCGEGQRMGIFAAAGGGKSTLLSMLIRNSAADVKVLALIGERGREVREFIEHDLGEEGLTQSVVVVATSERPAMERLKAGTRGHRHRGVLSGPGPEGTVDDGLGDPLRASATRDRSGGRGASDPPRLSSLGLRGVAPTDGTRGTLGHRFDNGALHRARGRR